LPSVRQYLELKRTLKKPGSSVWAGFNSLRNIPIIGRNGNNLNELNINNIIYIQYNVVHTKLYLTVLYIIYYISAYIQHNGDVSLEKKKNTLTTITMVNTGTLGKRMNKAAVVLSILSNGSTILGH